MAWNLSDKEIVSLRYADSTGQAKSATLRVDSGTADGTIQTLITRFQVESNASITSYTRHKLYVNDAPQAAVVFNKAVNPLNELSTSLQIDFDCGAGNSDTHTSILAPSNSNLVKGSFNKLRLDPASASYANIEASGQACMVNKAGEPVLTLQTTQVEMNKSRGLQ